MSVIYFALYKCAKCKLVYQLNSPEEPKGIIKCPNFNRCDGLMYRIQENNEPNS